MTPTYKKKLDDKTPKQFVKLLKKCNKLLTVDEDDYYGVEAIVKNYGVVSLGVQLKNLYGKENTPYLTARSHYDATKYLMKLDLESTIVDVQSTI